MKSKYYTPDISEFHVGFEYEVFDSKYEYKVEKLSETKLKVLSDPITTTGWFKEAYEIDSFLYVEDSSDIKSNIPSYIENDKVRVKYLDREDIESLGFEHDQSTKDGSYFYSGTLMTENQWCINLKDLIVDIYDINGKSDFRFDGFVKNKSELKRILKMIGYGEN